MAFLNPLVLMALAAAAIPLLIHLFNFRRARRIDYSSLHFLKELRRSTLQRVRVERWLLLLFRTLAVLCLIAAFARPILVGGAFRGDPKVSMAIVMDNSLSMGLRDARGTYLEQARAYARTLAKDADELFVLTTAPGRAARGLAALDAIDAAAPDARASAATASIARAAAVLQEEGTHLSKEVYFIGDMHQSTLMDTAAQAVPAEVGVTLVPVGGRAHDNIAIEDVRVISRIVEVGEPVRIDAVIKSYLERPVENYVASLFLEGARVAQRSVRLGPGERRGVSFLATPAARGWLAGRVEVEDDAFAADNAHHFALYVPEIRRVLVVRGPLATTGFVTLALTPGEDAVQVETIESTALARTMLSDYDAVLLVGPRVLSSGEIATLARYVDDGGGLMLFPSEVPTDINVLLEVLGGGRINGYAAADGLPMSKVTSLDEEHPLFEGVFEDAARMEQPSVFRAAIYAPKGGAEHTLLGLSSGRPFLQEIRKGRGLALVFAVSPDPSWSDLPVRGLFVPILHRAVHYLAAGESVQGHRLVAGQAASIRLGNSEGRVHVVTPAGEEVTPEQRQLVGATVIEMTTAHRERGIYDVTVGGALVRRMAMNLDSRESDLTAAPDAAEAVAEATGVPVGMLRMDDGTDVVQRLRQRRVGVELWRVLMVLALVFMVLEMVVSTRRREQTG